MLVLIFAIFKGGKYLLRNAMERASHMVNELGSSICSQSLALSFNEKGKSYNRIASVDTPLSLIVSNLVRKLRRCIVGLSSQCPLN